MTEPPVTFDGLGPVQWAARIRQRESQRTPSQVAADIAWMDEWYEGLCELPPLPLRPGQVAVVLAFNPKRGESPVRNKGQGLVEYALILILVAIVVIVILALLGPAVGNTFSNIIAKL